jgi:hypothetical protein
VSADPEQIEVIFLSAPYTSQLNEPIEWSNFVAELEDRDLYDCVPMGDKCFHPQMGLIDNPKKIKDVKPKKKEKGPMPEKNIKVQTFNLDDVETLECDKKFHFDVFCGNAKKVKQAKRPEYEIWIDTSSSMRNSDFSKDYTYCNRRRFVSKFVDKCRGKVALFTFDTSKKSLGHLSNLCLSRGLNDADNLVTWIKYSQAKKIWIITDVDEYNGAFREYLDKVNANIRGIGTSPFFSKDLVSQADQIEALCK